MSFSMETKQRTALNASDCGYSGGGRSIDGGGGASNGDHSGGGGGRRSCVSCVGGDFTDAPPCASKGNSWRKYQNSGFFKIRTLIFIYLNKLFM